MGGPADDRAGEAGELTLAEVAARADVSAATVRRWVAKGLVPGYEGHWTPAAVAYVRVVARLRALVFDEGGEELGQVLEFKTYPTVDVLVVSAKDGGRPWEVPLVEAVVRRVDADAGIVTLATLEGVERS